LKFLSGKGVFTAVVLVAWAGLMVVLAGRERGAPPMKGPDEDVREDWYLLKWYGLPMGRSVRRVGPRSDDKPGLAIEVDTTLRFSVADFPAELHMREVCLVHEDGVLDRFQLNVSTEALVSHRMRYQGQRVGDEWRVEIDPGGGTEKRKYTFEAPENLCLAETVTPYLMHRGEIREGASLTLPVYEPMSNEVAPMTIRVLGQEDVEVEEESITAWKLEALYKDLISTVSWITRDGVTLRERSEAGLMMVKTSGKDALDAELGLADVVGLTSISTGVEDSFFRGKESVRLKLSGVELSEFDFETLGQRWIDAEEGILEVYRTLPPVDPVAFPVRDPEMSEWLESDAYIQAEDERIVAQAKEAVGDAVNAWEAARRLQRWVHTSLKKKPVVSVPSAADVLASREGDCYEHTTLFVALARSVGIPAETCVGLVHLNGSYCYHAWPKVFVGEWVYMDPTFGQDVADVGHLCLETGNLSRQVKIMKLIGKLRIEPLTDESPSKAPDQEG